MSRPDPEGEVQVRYYLTSENSILKEQLLKPKDGADPECRVQTGTIPTTTDKTGCAGTHNVSALPMDSIPFVTDRSSLSGESSLDSLWFQLGRRLAGK